MPDPATPSNAELIARKNAGFLIDPQYDYLLQIPADFNFKPYMTPNSMVTGYHNYSDNPLGQALKPESMGIFTPNAWQATKTYEHELGHSFSVPLWGNKTDWNFPAPRSGFFDFNPQPDYNPMRAAKGLPPQTNVFPWQVTPPSPKWEEFTRALFNPPQGQPVFPSNPFAQDNPMEAYAYWSQNALNATGGRNQIPQNIQRYYPYLNPVPTEPLQGRPAGWNQNTPDVSPFAPVPAVQSDNQQKQQEPKPPEDPLAVVAPEPTITPWMQAKYNKFNL